MMESVRERSISKLQHQNDTDKQVVVNLLTNNFLRIIIATSCVKGPATEVDSTSARASYLTTGKNHLISMMKVIEDVGNVTADDG